MKIFKETWKPIPGYEGYYEISTYGRIRNLKRNRFVKAESNQPYYQVWLNKNGMREIKKIHHLVALTFLGECPDGYIVNHIDFNTHNNRLDNLEYITQLENIRHAAINRAWKSMVAPELESKIRQESNSGVSFSQLAQKYNLGYQTVRAICKRLTYAYSSGGIVEPVKERKVKITKELTEQIQSWWASGQYSQTAISKMTGINLTTVCLICNNKYSVKHLEEN